MNFIYAIYFWIYVLLDLTFLYRSRKVPCTIGRHTNPYTYPFLDLIRAHTALMCSRFGHKTCGPNLLLSNRGGRRWLHKYHCTGVVEGVQSGVAIVRHHHGLDNWYGLVTHVLDLRPLTLIRVDFSSELHVLNDKAVAI